MIACIAYITNANVPQLEQRDNVLHDNFSPNGRSDKTIIGVTAL